MKIEKSFTVNAAQDRIWAFITAPEKVAPCIPGCEDVTETEPGKYKALVKTKIGPVKATFKLDVLLLEENAPQFAIYQTSGEETGKASHLKAKSTLTLERIDDNTTRVSYSSEINVLGKLGKFGSGMMQKVADNIGGKFIEALKNELEK
ncbi:MAG: CoxG family protein [Gammaproteobacteria bacterium]